VTAVTGRVEWEAEVLRLVGLSWAWAPARGGVSENLLASEWESGTAPEPAARLLAGVGKDSNIPFDVWGMRSLLSELPLDPDDSVLGGLGLELLEAVAADDWDGCRSVWAVLCDRLEDLCLPQLDRARRLTGAA
jgi:hypothetical protein